MTLLLTKYHMVAYLSREIFTGLIHIQQMTSYSVSILQKRELKACVFPNFNIPAVMLYQLLEKKNSHCYIHLSKFTSKMDMWVTIDTDTKAALRWRKSFTVDEPDYVPLPMSFLLDEDKEVALFCACSEVS